MFQIAVWCLIIIWALPGFLLTSVGLGVISDKFALQIDIAALGFVYLLYEHFGGSGSFWELTFNLTVTGAVFAVTLQCLSSAYGRL